MLFRAVSLKKHNLYKIENKVCVWGGGVDSENEDSMMIYFQGITDRYNYGRAKVIFLKLFILNFFFEVRPH